MDSSTQFVQPVNWDAHLLPGSTFAPGDLLADGTLVAAWSRRWVDRPEGAVLLDATGKAWTAGALQETTRRIAARLLHEGLVPGDRVLVSAEASPRLAETVVGALRAGMTVVPANTAYQRREIAHIVTDSRPAAAFVDDAERARWVEEEASSHGQSLRLIAGSDPESSAPIDHPLVDTVAPGSPALIAYTSGTTGTPKGAILTHSNLLANAASITRAWRWTPDDRLLLALPLFHGHGLCNGLFGTLYAGASAVILPSFDPKTVIGAAQTFGATMFFGVPTMYHRLLSTPGVGAMRSLRLCVSGSAALPASLFEEFTVATGHRPLERYGATEVLMAVSNPYEGERRAGSVGVPLPGVEIRFGDVLIGEGDAASGEDNTASGEGDAAEVLVRSPMTFAGYRNLPGPTAEALEDGWFHTGDLASQSSDGYLCIKGRAKELIITGGLNVYPREVEDVLATHPAVVEVAVAGRPSEEWGEQVTAFVVTGDARSAELRRSIAEMAAADLAPYKRPKEVVFVDSLPRNALGKVMRHLLVE